MMAKILSSSFFTSENVVELSQKLLGKFLVTGFNGKLTSGMIIETEAYRGAEDKASHAYNNRRTPRTETLFQKGGIAYVYLCYGIHHLFNVVTGPVDVPHAVLIRAIHPADGLTTMLKRRKMIDVAPRLSAGPGTLTQALGIHKKHNGCPLAKTTEAPLIWLEDRGIEIPRQQIIATPRIGIDYAEEHRDLPWRFCFNGKSIRREKGSDQNYQF